MSTTNASISFYSHVLSGLARRRQAPSSDPARATIHVQSHIATAPGGASAHTIALDLTMYGPQDVTGLDTRHITREEPRGGAQDFEPNFIPFIEFDRPELPWIFSLTGADTTQPRPWLLLLVVPEHESVSITHAPELPNPVLELADIAALTDWKLPDLTDVWWWAHVQIEGDTPADPATVATTHPERAIARLVCPLKLSPSTRYVAALVPTYLGGVLAGLGEPLDGQTLEANAWDAATATSLRLPIYHHWRFHTGRAGDFELLARRLKGRSLEDTPTGREMSVDPAQFRESISPGQSTWETTHEGSLKVPDTTPDPIEFYFKDAYRNLFDPALSFPSGTPTRPLVRPPLCGRWQAGVESLSSTQPTWLDELNTDPRLRVVAGAARKIVQDKQESLMRSAWDQAESVKEVNDLLSRSQLGRQVSGVMHDRLTALDATGVAQLTSPQHDRIFGEGGSASLDSAGKAIREDRTLATSPMFRAELGVEWYSDLERDPNAHHLARLEGWVRACRDERHGEASRWSPVRGRVLRAACLGQNADGRRGL